MEAVEKYGSNVDVIIPGSKRKLRVLEQLVGLNELGKDITLLKCLDFAKRRTVIVEPNILVQGIQKHDAEIKVDYMVSVLNDQQEPVTSFVCTSEVKFYNRLSKILKENLHKLNDGQGLLFSVYRHEHGGSN
jgi:hypothetical protein